ncbi:MAG: noncanonical pyrimidine nucleotidase, YjjG family [Clostridia bacterium]|nr:noncanonical pyrimidine nucleotidase, YjjG family [Clostridia bacterium]
MDYKILLFDLDDTLLDFGANEAASLKRLFCEHGLNLTHELFQIYSAVNERLWSDCERGLIPLSEVLNTRFSRTLLNIGHSGDGAAWERRYRELLGEGTQLIDGAFELCRSLAFSHRLFIITNGVTETQISRLRRSGLYECFEDVFISQEIGYQKPSKEFFKYVTSHICDFSAENALVIGDSLNADIKGGILAGIDTCWLNRNLKPLSSEIRSTYIISNLEQLHGILS